MRTHHFTRPCGILIKKPKLRILDEYNAFKGFILASANVPSYDDWIAYKQKLVKTERDRLQSVLGKVLIEPIIDPDNFYLVEHNIAIEGSSAPVNNRVITTSVNQFVDTAWTATIVLDNTDDKYYLKDTFTTDNHIYFQEKECVIESNDMVQIFLPDWEDQLGSVFTGYVNRVSVTDNEEVKRITLQCEDVTKLLAASRTSQNPSLDIVEAEGAGIAIFNPSWANKKPAEIVKYIFGRSFLNIFNDPLLIQDLRTTLSALSSVPSNSTLAQQRGFALSQFSVLVDKAIDRYTEEVTNADGKVTGYTGYRVAPILVDPSVVNPTLDLFGKSSPLFTSIPKVISDTFKYTKSAMYKFGKERIAFEISSLNQPVYALQFNSGSYNFINSEWMSNDVLVKSIAEKCFFEFYADHVGVVHFKPKALTLPKVSTKMTETEKSYIMDNYWITERVDENKRGYKSRNFFVRNWASEFNDRAVCTGVFVQGQFITGTTLETMGKVVNSPLKFRRKFGIRMLPQETRLGLLNIPSLQAYAQQRLWRQNAQAYEAGIEFVGNSKLHCGNPIYIERWSSVYYIEEVTHSYTAMDDYTTNVKLLYRRKPIALLGASYPNIKQQLQTLVTENELSAEERDYILAEQDSLTWGKFSGHNSATSVIPTRYGDIIQVPSLDIVWEAIPTILRHGELTVAEGEITKLKIAQESVDKATFIVVAGTVNPSIQEVVKAQSTGKITTAKLGALRAYDAAEWTVNMPVKLSKAISKICCQFE